MKGWSEGGQISLSSVDFRILRHLRIMWKGVPGHLLMAENKLQEKVLGNMPRLAWEYRNIPSNSLIHHCP